MSKQKKNKYYSSLIKNDPYKKVKIRNFLLKSVSELFCPSEKAKNRKEGAKKGPPL